MTPMNPESGRQYVNFSIDLGGVEYGRFRRRRVRHKSISFAATRQ
jgi:hypothetical protein